MGWTAFPCSRGGIETKKQTEIEVRGSARVRRKAYKTCNAKRREEGRVYAENKPDAC